MPSDPTSHESDPASLESQAVIALPDPGSPKFPIVGIGASAGGLAAYEAFFSAMPTDSETGMAFVLVQHLSPDHKSILSELVRRYTRMQVYEVEDGIEVQPNCAYIIPPNRDMALSKGRLRLYEPNAPRGQRLPIDFFFRSLAAEHHERAICLVLSGTGSDGTLGVRAIKGEGGMAMAQSPDMAEHDGMPRSAIATALVDYVLPPSQMPAQLIAYVRHAFAKAPGAATPALSDDGMLRVLTTLLRVHTGHDFSQYKSTTLLRRMERRMALHQIVQAEDYFRYARQYPTELDALFRDMLIGVTNFFRDPDAFVALQEKVIPGLFAGKAAQEIRVWVCGCSTGEEAYSIAILLQEHMETLKRTFKVQIFATDIDNHSIDQARTGLFPASIAADISPERLSRYFTHDPNEGTYRVQKVIRDLLVFSAQDVIRDPPFSKLDLISCRNLMIYLNSEVQRKLIPLFHYALRPRGYLFLGTSETTGEFMRLFAQVDRKWKIYSALTPESTARPSLGDMAPLLHENRDLPRPIHGREAVGAARNLGSLIEQALLAHYAEVGVLINGRGEILHIHGRTGNYLEPAAGEPAMNILTMAREGLRRPLTTALHRAVAKKEAVSYSGVQVKANGDPVFADLTVRPAFSGSVEGTVDMFLVVLKETAAPETKEAPAAAAADQTGRIAELEHELRSKEEYLQTTLEEMETTNEELKSTNEEMQSVNEELQSTNEELETSKEELQSVNEELSTVNTELQDKVVDLSRTNNDMNNLLAGTGIGTVFVDQQLRIARFTPSAMPVMNLIATDVGRPVEHIASNLIEYSNLTEAIREVLETLMPAESEVQAKSGTWYLMRIRPYRTLTNVIDGVVLTFVDISQRKLAERALSLSEARVQSMFNAVQAGLVQMDMTGRFLFANNQQCAMLGYTREELLGLRLQDVTHPEDLKRNLVLFYALAAGGPDFQIEKRYQRKDGSAVLVSDRVSALRDANGKIEAMVGISIDLSERKRLELEAGATDARFTAEMDALSRLEGVRSLAISDSNRDAVLDQILEAAIAITGADMGNIQVFEQLSQDLVIVAHRGFERDFIEHANRVGKAPGHSGGTVEKRRPMIVEDVTESPIFAGTLNLAVQLSAGVRAIQSTPLISSSGSLVGVISTHFRVPHLPDERIIRIFDLLAREAADIIERADGAAPPRRNGP